MLSSRPPEASKPSAFQPVSLSFRRTSRAAREEWIWASERKWVRTSTWVREPSIAATEPFTRPQSGAAAGPGTVTVSTTRSTTFSTILSGAGAGGTASSRSVATRSSGKRWRAWAGMLSEAFEMSASISFRVSAS